jgi:hypothetical protein
MDIQTIEDLHPDDQQHVTALDDLSKLAFDSYGRLILTKSGKPKKRAGRPSKQELEATGKLKKGRVNNEAARINELKARLLATTGDKVINKIVEAALTDGHPSQTAAMKMCMDRVLPLSYFEKEKDGTGRTGINITITGVGGDTTIVGTDEPIEGEFRSE